MTLNEFIAESEAVGLVLLPGEPIERRGNPLEVRTRLPERFEARHVYVIRHDRAEKRWTVSREPEGQGNSATADTLIQAMAKLGEHDDLMRLFVSELG